MPFGIKIDAFSKTVVEKIREVLDGMGLTFFFSASVPSVVASDEQIVGLIDLEVTALTIEVRCRGSQILVDEFNRLFEEVMPGDATPAIRRIQATANGLRAFKETINPLAPLNDFYSAYPFLDQSPAEVWAAFKASNANVLLLIGPPGTGKSNFIMGLLQARGWDGQTFLADSDEILQHPELINFVRNVTKGSLVVTEDSDGIVAKREDGNSVMSGLLNATAGLISTDTKFIISTNLSSLAKVDPALVRPGRTFRVMHFRTLTNVEAITARAGLGLPYVDFQPCSAGWTLAAILNSDEDTPESGRAIQRVGFCK